MRPHFFHTITPDSTRMHPIKWVWPLLAMPSCQPTDSEKILLGIKALCTRSECKNISTTMAFITCSACKTWSYLYTHKYPEAMHRLLPWKQAFYLGSKCKQAFYLGSKRKQRFIIPYSLSRLQTTQDTCAQLCSKRFVIPWVQYARMSWYTIVNQL